MCRRFLLTLLLSVASVTAVADEKTIDAVLPDGFSGVVLVERDGKVVHRKAYGLADREARTANEVTTLFDVASVSKQFTATAILKLQAAGKLRTSDSIARHLAGVPEDKAGVTIHHLLTHTSGIPVEVGVFGRHVTRRQRMIAKVMRAPLVWKPGTRWVYNNVGYTLLAAIVEKASGKPFEAYLRETVFGPAKMTDTGFVRDTQLSRDRAAKRYVGDKQVGSAVEHAWGWGYKGATGVVSTVDDLLRWDRALRGEKILSAAQKKQLFTPALGGYAYGWIVGSTIRDTAWISHPGAVPGFSSMVSRYPDEKTLILLLANTELDATVVTQRIEAVVLGDPFAKTGAKIDPDTLGRLGGAYAWPRGGRLDVVPRDGTLELVAEGQEVVSRLILGSAYRAGWDRIFYGYNSTAIKLFEKVVADPDAFKKALEPPAANAAIATWKRCAKSGQPGAPMIIGSRNGPPMQTYVKVAFGSAVTRFGVTWGEYGRIGKLETVESHPFRLRLAAVSDTRWVAKSMSGKSRVPIVFVMPPTGRSTALVWRAAGIPVTCKRSR